MGSKRDRYRDEDKRYYKDKDRDRDRDKYYKDKRRSYDNRSHYRSEDKYRKVYTDQDVNHFYVSREYYQDDNTTIDVSPPRSNNSPNNNGMHNGCCCYCGPAGAGTSPTGGNPGTNTGAGTGAGPGTGNQPRECGPNDTGERIDSNEANLFGVFTVSYIIYRCRIEVVIRAFGSRVGGGTLKKGQNSAEFKIDYAGYLYKLVFNVQNKTLTVRGEVGWTYLGFTKRENLGTLRIGSWNRLGF